MSRNIKKTEKDIMNVSIKEVQDNKNISTESNEERSNIELIELFRNATSTQEKLEYYSKITNVQIQLEILNEVQKEERHKFIGRIKSAEGISTALNGLEDIEAKRKTFKFIAKQLKGNNEEILRILSQINFDVKLPSDNIFKLNNLNALNKDFLMNIQKHTNNYSEMKFKINEYQGDSKTIEYSFDEIYAIIEKIEELTADIPENLDEANKFYAIYSRIIQMISYDHSCIREQEIAEREKFNSNDKLKVAVKKWEKKQEEIRKKPAGLYGGLIEGRAICAGYALILNEALKYMGIKCQYIKGIAPVRKENKTKRIQAHAWNQVQIDGKWYNVDPTWDSAEFKICRKYKYMLLNDEDFSRTHRKFFEARTKTERKCKNRFDYSKIQGLSPNQIGNVERVGHSL